MHPLGALKLKLTIFYSFVLNMLIMNNLEQFPSMTKKTFCYPKNYNWALL